MVRHSGGGALNSNSHSYSHSKRKHGSLARSRSTSPKPTNTTSGTAATATATATSTSTSTSTNESKLSYTRQQHKQRLTTILGSFLEILIHEILYLRRLYPRDAFSSTRYYGVTTHACRHPDVVKYIYQSLLVCVPALCSSNNNNGGGGGSGGGTAAAAAADGLYVILYDCESEELIEQYVLEFDLDDVVQIVSTCSEKKNNHNHHKPVTNTTSSGGGSGSDGTKGNDTQHHTNMSEGEILDYKVQQLERGLRDILLKVVSLHGSDLGRVKKPRHSNGIGNRDSNGLVNLQRSLSSSTSTTISDTATFKICLHTVDNNTNEGQQSQTQSQSQSQRSSSASASKSSCPELDNAMMEGTWMRSDSSQWFRNVASSRSRAHNVRQNDAEGGSNNDDSSSHLLSRPLKSIHVPSCGLQMKVLMEIPK